MCPNYNKNPLYETTFIVLVVFFPLIYIYWMDKKNNQVFHFDVSAFMKERSRKIR
jgi:hypothetical protein